MSDALRVALTSLANARADLYAIDETLRAAKLAFDATHAEDLARAAALRSAVAIAEGQCRATALLAFHRTGDTVPAPGVVIKQYTTLAYSVAVAFAWAKEKRMALSPESLDVAAFEKIARATPLPFVSMAREPRAQVASHINAADYATPSPVPVAAAALDENPFL